MGPIKAQHGFARNTEFSVVTLNATSVTLSLSPNQEQRQGDFPEHTLFIKVLCSAHVVTYKCIHMQTVLA